MTLSLQGLRVARRHPHPCMRPAYAHRMWTYPTLHSGLYTKCAEFAGVEVGEEGNVRNVGNVKMNIWPETSVFNSGARRFYFINSAKLNLNPGYYNFHISIFHTFPHYNAKIFLSTIPTISSLEGYNKSGLLSMYPKGVVYRAFPPV